MSKSYEAFLADPKNVPEGVDIRLFVKDLTPGPRKYDARFVKARVRPLSEQLSGSDTLRLRSLDGKLHPDVFAFEILEELGEYVAGLPYTPHTGIFPEHG